MTYIYRRLRIRRVGAARHCLCILLTSSFLTLILFIALDLLVFSSVELPGFKLNISPAKPYYQAKSKYHRLGRVGENEEESVQINLAVAACQDRGRQDVIVMLKSALIFSQDAHLHLYIFSNAETIDLLLEDLVKLQEDADKLRWQFSFSLYMEWWPEVAGVDFKGMWQPCASQRLFFPSLLADVDGVIYLDADTIVLSSLKEFWLKIPNELGYLGLVAMAANNEYPAKGFYSVYSDIPYYGERGVNDGVMLMNLKGLRRFGIEARILAAQVLYNERISLADQDLYNIIFHGFPERLLPLECTYNFNWVHCGGGPAQRCALEKETGPVCFCWAALSEGIKIVHGNMKTFAPKWPFLYQTQQAFKNFNLLEDNPLEMVEDLMEKFDALEETPACFNLSSPALYGNAKRYLEQLKR